MMTSFSFARTPILHFGPGKLSMLITLVKQYGKNILIITGASSFVSGPHWRMLQQSFRDSNMNLYHFSVDREPSPALIDSCVEAYKDSNIHAVAAIGGGSVLDAGKAISAMLPLGDSVKYYLEGVGRKIHSGVKIPFIAVPTTSGTGSEATKNAVLSEIGKEGFKRSLRHDLFVPDIALVDPELTLSCPPAVTASSGMDAFTQLLESYLSTSANRMTDSLATEGLKCIRDSLISAWEKGSENLAARTDISYAALISGITLANAGLGTVHGFASAIGGFFDIPHGVICSSLMGPANRITAEKLLKADKSNWAVHKYSLVGSLFSKQENRSPEYNIQFLLDLIETWTQIMSIPKLSHYGVASSDFERIVKATDNKNNPVKLNADELKTILALAL